jgi:hypothetical protein
MKENVLWLQFLWRSAMLFTGLLSTIASGQTLKQVAKFDLPGPPGLRLSHHKRRGPLSEALSTSRCSAPFTAAVDLSTHRLYAPERKKITNRWREWLSTTL